MEIGGYRKEYLQVLYDNFPFVDYVTKYTDLERKKDEWVGVCPICEFCDITLTATSWHCKNCLMTADGVEPIFYSPEAFLSKFHRLAIFDAICLMEGWVNTHTDIIIPKERYVYVENPFDSVPELLENYLHSAENSIQTPGSEAIG
jgi:hypothetical protein